MISREALLAFLRQDPYAVQASVAAGGVPQAALVGVAVSEQFEIVFDTLGSTRKAENLRANPVIALVFGSAAAGTVRTVQLEGAAVELQAGDPLIELYLVRFPDGRARQAWPGITWFGVTPAWLCYSDFAQDPPAIVEYRADELASLL